MRNLLLGLLLTAVLLAQDALPAGADSPIPETDRQAIVGVIKSQLDAFQRDDGVEAFSYASPIIQRRFQNPEIFMSMVKGGYRAVYRPQSFEFLEQRTAGSLILQAVHFVGPDGRAVVAIYTMQKQADGTWRIAGVQLVETEEVVS